MLLENLLVEVFRHMGGRGWVGELMDSSYSQFCLSIISAARKAFGSLPGDGEILTLLGYEGKSSGIARSHIFISYTWATTTNMDPCKELCIFSDIFRLKNLKI
jgi:hypothetical protein